MLQKLVILLISVIGLNNFKYGNCAPVVLQRGEVPAFIVFGDSIVDPGNNNHLNTVVKCNFPPYGKDFQGRAPTGRFSNGFVPSDLLAQLFSIKETLPAYLDPNLNLQDLLTGVSFASGGSGYDPLTPTLVSVLSMPQQLELFKKYLAQLRSGVGEDRTATILSKSVYLLVAGSDDIANTYYSTPVRRAQYDIASYTDLMTSAANSFIQDLYGLGARKIGVISAPPIGCVPSQRTSGGGLARECAEKLNRAAIIFNSKLKSSMDALSEKFDSETRLVYMNAYDPLLNIIQNPSQYGFEVATKGCCGTGTLEVSVLCNPYSPGGTCSNASDHIFWDSYHPTQTAYIILVQKLFDTHASEFF